jgi:hypothetical protein
MSPRTRRPVGRQVATPPRGTKTPGSNAGLALPHECDESSNPSAVAPDPGMAQAKRDIDGGLVDINMRATPGLDARLRARLGPWSWRKAAAAARLIAAAGEHTCGCPTQIPFNRFAAICRRAHPSNTFVRTEMHLVGELGVCAAEFLQAGDSCP